jgi:hypothetical protein
MHPVAANIAETYGVSYEEVMGWFCKDTGTTGEGEEPPDEPCDDPTGETCEEPPDETCDDPTGETCEPVGEEGEEGTTGKSKFGFGEIVLALHTADIADVSVDELLNQRQEGQGWGQIWKELGYNGKPKETASEDDTSEGDAGVTSEEDSSTDEDSSPGNSGKKDKDKDKGKKDKNKDKGNSNKGNGKSNGKGKNK